MAPAGWIRPARTLVIASTPRSGSTWIGNLMSLTGLLGRPREFLGHWGGKAPTADTVGAALRRMRAEGTSDNDVTAVKVFPRHFETVTRVARFSDWYPDARYIHIVRRDLLDQAISLQRARSSGSFYPEMPERQPPVYDAGAIDGHIGRLAADNAAWNRYFSRTGIDALTILYEEAVRDPAATVQAIASHARVDVPFSQIRTDSEIVKMSDVLNADWRRRFLAERGCPDRFEPTAPPERRAWMARLLRRPAAANA